MTMFREIKKYLSKVPFWAIALVCIVIFTNTVFFINKFNYPYDGKTLKSNDDWHIKSVIKDSPADIAGVKQGDLVYSFLPKDSSLIENRISFIWGAFKSGDVLNYTIIRDGNQMIIPVTLGSIMNKYGPFYIFLFVFFILFSVSGTFMLYKKPGVFSVKLFFICIQLFIILSNGRMMFYRDVTANFANAFYWTAAFLTGPLLIHFHLIFPEKSVIIKRFERFPWILYVLSAIGILFIISYYNFIFKDSIPARFTFIRIESFIPLWYFVTMLVALLIALFRFATIKNTLAKNQLQIILIGASVTLIFPFIRAFFPKVRTEFWDIIPFIYPDLIGGLTTIIFIGCILIAIFKYKIWETGLYISKAFQYIIVSAFISLTYLLLISTIEIFISGETMVLRFSVLLISILIFIFVRNRFQGVIDKLFYRKKYNTEVAISEFESRTAGVFNVEELFEKITIQLNKIFHFQTFALYFIHGENQYKHVALISKEHNVNDFSFYPDSEFLLKALKWKVFSLFELNSPHSYFIEMNADLIVPIKSDERLEGFMVCGPKRSEKVYDHKDINLLELLAKRISSLIFTTKLYQKDLENQLALHKERNRISRDMHDELGAGLTKISLLSELSTLPDLHNEDTFKRLENISISARDLVSKLNVIIWALNPDYNNLDSLIGYIRRYIGDYLENTGIEFSIKSIDTVPDIKLPPEYRRNVYYSVQEAVNNAVKHSSCSTISISINLENKFLSIMIKDDGKGFDPSEERSYRNGLSNLKKRAHELNGSCEIISSPGNGCIVKMRFSLL